MKLLNLTAIPIVNLIISLSSLAHDKLKDHTMMLSCVNDGVSITYKNYEPSRKVEILEINGLPFISSDKKSLTQSLLKLQKYLEKRPEAQKKTITSTVTLDSSRFEGVLLIGGKSDHLFLFRKTSIEHKELVKYTNFLRAYPRKTKKKKAKEDRLYIKELYEKSKKSKGEEKNIE